MELVMICHEGWYEKMKLDGIKVKGFGNFLGLCGNFLGWSFGSCYVCKDGRKISLDTVMRFDSQHIDNRQSFKKLKA